MHAIVYTSAGIRAIDRIRPLWESLNAYYHRINPRFRAYYEKTDFEARKAYFCGLCRTGLFRLELATDRETRALAGYCAASVSDARAGEIESLFVAPAYRSRGIGTMLVSRSLGWMGSRKAERIRVSVSTGNEDVLPFYRKFGFFPRLIVLEQTGADPS